MTPKDAASILPRKDVEGQIQGIDDNGSFTMYALVFGNIDRQGDIIEPGAVKNIAELVSDGWVAHSHNHGSLPVAMINTAVQDNKGLRLEGTFHSTPLGQELRTIVRERLAAGKSVKTSIGYMPLSGGEQYEKQGGKTVRRLSKINVYEASFVNLPANPLAEVVSAKSAEAPMDTKAGRKISASNLQKLKGYASQLAEHHKAAAALADEFSGYLGGFDPVADDPHEIAMPDALKAVEPPPITDAATDGPMDEAKLLELKRRALSLKFPNRVG